MSRNFLAKIATIATATITGADQLLSTQDRFIFWIGGTLAFLATLFLVIGSLRFKELRKQPGDLIVGIALSDMALAIHWLILATWYEKVSDPAFCHFTGSLGIVAGASEYFYNIAFNFFLITSLRNALKQARIPKKTFHTITLSLSAIFLIVLYYQGKVGRTSVGTCSIISSDSQGGFSKYLASMIVGSYAFVGLYTLYYIRKNAPKCAQSHNKRTHFILYYSRYIIASIIIYSSIAVTNFLTIKFNLAWVNSLYNIAKLCSPLVLSFIRYNDPLIKRIMIQTIFFWRKPAAEPTHNNSISDPLIHLNSSNTHENEFVFNVLSAERRVEIVYTLLSCVLYSDYIERNHAKLSSTVIDMKESNPYKHQRLHQIGDNAIRYLFPAIKDELDRVKYSVLPGTLKVYAPEIFSQLLEDDKLYLNIQESLNFQRNRDQIKDASGPGGGKSGEFFFFSSDKKLIIKTIPDVEMQQISRILERYQEHMRRNPNSLIAKIYGAFTFQSTDYDQTFNLIIMKNISGFSSAFVESIYDMKGSTYDREVLKNLDGVAADGVKKGVLKDLDFEKFEKRLHIRPDIRIALIHQIEADSLFLRSVKLIDYSFMVFFINKRKYIEVTGNVPEDGFITKNQLASLEKLDMMGNGTGIFYHVGIVDYLQPYNFNKFMEKLIKKVKKLDANLDTSSQNPQVYSTRFINFIKKIAQ